MSSLLHDPRLLTGAAGGLAARTARMLNEVAAVIEHHGSPEAGATGAALFLRDWAVAAEPENDRTPPLDRLAQAYRLTGRECDLIVLAGLSDEHEGVAATFRTLHPSGESSPTVGLAALVLGGTAGDRARLRALLETGAATRHGLLRLSDTGSFYDRSLLLPDRLWSALHGHDAWPTRLARVQVPPVPPGLDGWIETPRVQAAVGLVARGERAVVLVTGDDPAVRLARCAGIAAAAGLQIAAAGVGPGDRERLASLAAHASLRGQVPLAVVETAGETGAGELDLSLVPGTLLVSAGPGVVQACPDRAVVVLPTGPVGLGDQRLAWSLAVAGLGVDPDQLAARHPLDPALTAQVALDISAQPGTVGLADVSTLIRTRVLASLPTGVQLVTPRTGWDHLVLPVEQAAQLQAAVARLHHQATVLDDWGLRDSAHATRGARLLLTGPPGTGKSLAAHAVATAAGTDLLLVDVSRVVSKWLGETEKNLAAAFAAAERTQAVLLLDEADALFGSRTEISDAHDRYANLETAYLLQRLDTFEGLAILTTNLRANIDVAFIRRMDFVVEFGLPDEIGRTELWRRHLPLGFVDTDVDLGALARLYRIPGAWIRNAALAAAFTAADERATISQDHLVAATRREYLKADLTFPGEPPRRRHDRQ